MKMQPYVVGQWVCGDRFYGRTSLIAEILEGHRNCLWLLGTRRLGKTSLLRQVEYLADQDQARGYLPMFWDFQGAENAQELLENFNDALLEAEDRLQRVGIETSEIESPDLFASLSKLRRRVRSKNLTLLLLCDEAEELLTLQRNEPSLLRKLRRALQSMEGMRTVLASTIRLWNLVNQQDDTSPFLHGFTPPLYIEGLTSDEATSLIQQGHLPEDRRPLLPTQAEKTIRERCAGHPYLIQLVCKRVLELEDLEEAIDQVATDRMVSYFFAVDFEMLSGSEQEIVRLVLEREAMTADDLQVALAIDRDGLKGSLLRLRHLGYLSGDSENGYRITNYFFERWFRAQPRAFLSDERVESVLALGLKEEDPAASEMPTRALLGERYDLMSEVGRGASGVVYKAFDRLLEADVAIKVFKKGLAEDPESLARFRKEIVLTMDISHPHVLPVYHLEQIDGTHFLTMKWIDGETLAESLAGSRPYSQQQVVGFALRIASALGALHARRIVHRDVKPQNILIERSGEPFLADFGLVRLMEGKIRTRDGVFVGTPAYASPEQAARRSVDPRSDVYSLGAVMFEAVTGERLFAAESVEEVLDQHREAQPRDPCTIEPTVSREFGDMVLRCLEKDPDRRFADGTALEHAIGRLAAKRAL